MFYGKEKLVFVFATAGSESDKKFSIVMDESGRSYLRSCSHFHPSLQYINQIIRRSNIDYIKFTGIKWVVWIFVCFNVSGGGMLLWRWICATSATWRRRGAAIAACTLWRTYKESGIQAVKWMPLNAHFLFSQDHPMQAGNPRMPAANCIDGPQNKASMLHKHGTQNLCWVLKVKTENAGTVSLFSETLQLSISPRACKGFVQTGWSLVNPLLCCLSKYRINEITLRKQGLSCGIQSLDCLGTSPRNHQRNLGLCVSTVRCGYRCQWTLQHLD